MFIIETKFYQIKIITMIKSYDESFEINHNPNGICLKFLTILIKLLVVQDQELYNLIKHQRLDIDETYLYVKDPFESISINYLLMEEKK